MDFKELVSKVSIIQELISKLRYLYKYFLPISNSTDEETLFGAITLALTNLLGLLNYFAYCKSIQ